MHLIRTGSVALLVALLVAGGSGQVTRQPQESDTIKVETSLVLVPVSVRTRQGTGLPDLKREQFRIFEDKVEQQIAHFETPGEPITVAIVIDMSDSAKMSLAEMRAAASAFLDQLQPRDKALIVAFDRNIHHIIGATSDRDALRLGLLGVGTGGGTALYDTVGSVVSSLLANLSGRKAAIVLTDGIDTASRRETYETSARLVAEGTVAIFPVQYQPETFMRARLSASNSHIGATIYTTPSGESIASAYQRGTRYLRLVADASGGRFQFADTRKNLEAAFAQIAAELRQLYFIGFYPERDASKRERRDLKVTVKVPGAKVESRKSYIATPQ